MRGFLSLRSTFQEVDVRLVDYFIALIFIHFTELIKQRQDNSKIVKVIDELMQSHESSVSLQTFEFHEHVVYNGNYNSDEAEDGSRYRHNDTS